MHHAIDRRRPLGVAGIAIAGVHAGNASVADERASEEFSEAEHNADVLQQVRDALGRLARRHVRQVHRRRRTNRRAPAGGRALGSLLSEARNGA